ncbi:MAG: hypothetical protein ACE5GA_07495 [Candidatus Zixiibacteriota bacterium]
MLNIFVNWKLPLFFLSAATISRIALADNGRIEISTSLSDSLVVAEDSVILSCEVVWDQDAVHPLSQSPPSLRLKRLEVGSVNSRSGVITRDGRRFTRSVFRYTLRPTRSGLGMIEPLEVAYISLPDSIPLVASSGGMSVRITIPPGVRTESGPGTWLWITLALALAAVSTVAALMMKSRRESGSEIKALERELQLRLGKLKVLTSGSRADFYTEMHSLLSQVCSLNVDTPDGALTLDQFEPELERRLERWLAESARSKFIPGRGEPGELLRRFVEIEACLAEEVIHKLKRMEKQTA